MDYTYTTGPITGSCTVNASFVINSFALTTHITGPGTFVCSPSTVALGGSSSCTFSTVTGYTGYCLCVSGPAAPPRFKDMIVLVRGGHF